MQLHPALVQVGHILVFAPALLAEVHDVAHIFRRGDDAGLDKGLLGVLDLSGVRVVQGCIDLHHGAVGLVDVVDDVGCRGDEIEVVLPFETLHDDLHVEQAQEAAAEAEAQGDGVLLGVGHGGVVQLQLLEGVPQVAVLGAVGGVDAGKHHGLHGLVAGKGLVRGVLGAGDGVADPGVGDGLDGGGQVADLAGAQLIHRHHALRFQSADLDDAVDGAGAHHFDFHAGPDGAVEHAQVHDDAPVGVVLAVEDQSLEGRTAVALGRRHVPHHHLEDGVDVDAVLGGNLRGVHGRQADDVLDLLLDLLGPGSGQVDLVDDGQDLQPLVHGQVGVGQGLGLDALGGVDHQDCALAGGQAAGNLVIEVHMARGVDQVEDIGLPVVSGVVQLDGPGLDGDAALPLEVHGVEDLVLHLPKLDGVAFLQQAVGQGGLAMVNVGDDRKIPDFCKLGHEGSLRFSVYRLVYSIFPLL